MAEEAEERRLAELRAHGTPVTPSTFAEWKARFAAEMAQARARQEGEADRRDAGPSGKAFFRQMVEVSALTSCALYLGCRRAGHEEGWGPQAGQVLRDAEDGEYEMESEAEEEEEVTLDGDDGEPLSLSCADGFHIKKCRGETWCVLGRR